MTPENYSKPFDRRHFLQAVATVAAGALITPALLAAGQDGNRKNITRYPDPAIKIIDKRFEKYPYDPCRPVSG